MKNFIFIPLFVCLFSCNDKYEAILDQAEQMLEQHPDSSYTILSSIYLDNIQGMQNKARFALLYSKVLDKNYIDVKDDSLARFAVDYYAEEGTYLEKATAYYYLARVYENAEDVEQCIANLALASKLVPDDSYYLKGLIHSSFGRKYREQGSYNDAIIHYKLSLEVYEKYNNKRNQGTALSNISSCLRNQKMYDGALESKLKALKIFTELKDTTSILLCKKGIALLNLRKGKAASAVKKMVFENYEKYNYGKIPAEDYFFLSNLYIQLDNMDSAKYYLNLDIDINKATQDKSDEVATLEKNRTNYRSALEYGEKIDLLIDSISIKKKKTQILCEKHKSELYKKSLYKVQRDKIILIVFTTLLSLSLLACVLLIFYIKKYILLKKDNKLRLFDEQLILIEEAKSNLEQRYKNLLLEIHHIDKQEVDAINKIEATLGDINKLLKTAYTYQKSPETFIAAFKNIMSSSANDEKAHIHIRYIANKKHSGVISYLQNNYNLSTFEIDLCSMICLGFNIDTIRVIYGHENMQSIYNKRSKLKLKLKTSGSIEEFLNDLIITLAKDHNVD